MPNYTTLRWSLQAVCEAFGAECRAFADLAGAAALDADGGLEGAFGSDVRGLPGDRIVR